jgi:hypothetical protein
MEKETVERVVVASNLLRSNNEILLLLSLLAEHRASFRRLHSRVHRCSE